MKKIYLTLLIVLAAAVAESHEFWLQPQKFKYKVGEDLTLRFMVGDHFEGEPWDLQKHKIEKLELHHLAKFSDLRSAVAPAQKEKLKYQFTEAGTHLVALQSDASFMESDAQKFNDYLKEDGLENVMALRKKTGTENTPAKELYTRFAKLLVQVGDKTDATFKKKVGLRIEIIPQQNPYALKTGDYLQCLVLFDGKPAKNQLTKVWNKVGNTAILQNMYTENDGMIKFPISSKGPWMVSSVTMIPSQKTGADWQSFWGSLLFGIE
ncbi:MAG: DUF4198 domain-containing protein [Bacteroidetes bacterium]|nr:DUF4198 domain-containing protein [Bacteroidota bacterium]